MQDKFRHSRQTFVHTVPSGRPEHQTLRLFFGFSQGSYAGEKHFRPVAIKKRRK